MDADIVKEVEFSRRMRGYDMGEVDAFLEKIEANPKEPKYVKVVWGTGYKVG